MIVFQDVYVATQYTRGLQLPGKPRKKVAGDTRDSPTPRTLSRAASEMIVRKGRTSVGGLSLSRGWTERTENRVVRPNSAPPLSGYLERDAMSRTGDASSALLEGMQYNIPVLLVETPRATSPFGLTVCQTCRCEYQNDSGRDHVSACKGVSRWGFNFNGRPSYVWTQWAIDEVGLKVTRVCLCDICASDVLEHGRISPGSRPPFKFFDDLGDMARHILCSCGNWLFSPEWEAVRLASVTIGLGFTC